MVPALEVARAAMELDTGEPTRAQFSEIVLACTRFVDAQIGRVLDALEEEGLEENTIVVLWSDHGWHLGEKGITGKNTLWERSTRVPLVLAGPGITKGQESKAPVELLDLYPTLIDLCGLDEREDLEGVRLTPQLINAQTPRDRPAITRITKEITPSVRSIIATFGMRMVRKSFTIIGETHTSIPT